MATRMFAGELDGRLVLSWIDHRADVVRSNIAQMVEPGPDHIGWAKAKKLGWRVVPVNVERAR